MAETEVDNDTAHGTVLLENNAVIAGRSKAEVLAISGGEGQLCFTNSDGRVKCVARENVRERNWRTITIELYKRYGRRFRKRYTHRIEHYEEGRSILGFGWLKLSPTMVQLHTTKHEDRLLIRIKYWSDVDELLVMMNLTDGGIMWRKHLVEHIIDLKVDMHKNPTHYWMIRAGKFTGPRLSCWQCAHDTAPSWKADFFWLRCYQPVRLEVGRHALALQMHLRTYNILAKLEKNLLQSPAVTVTSERPVFIIDKQYFTMLHWIGDVRDVVMLSKSVDQVEQDSPHDSLVILYYSKPSVEIFTGHNFSSVYENSNIRLPFRGKNSLLKLCSSDNQHILAKIQTSHVSGVYQLLKAASQNFPLDIHTYTYIPLLLLTSPRISNILLNSVTHPGDRCVVYPYPCNQFNNSGSSSRSGSSDHENSSPEESD